MMNKITFTVAFVAALCTASPVEVGKELTARTSIPFVMSNYNAYPCDSATIRELGVSITPGQCHNINFPGWGAEVYNPNIDQNCVLKFWDTADCTGKATTWFASGSTTGDKCFASARQGDVNKFGAGSRSVIANCAFDVVPGGSWSA